MRFSIHEHFQLAHRSGDGRLPFLQVTDVQADVLKPKLKRLHGSGRSRLYPGALTALAASLISVMVMPTTAQADTPPGTYAYVTYGADAVAVIDTATNSVSATVTVGDIPVDVAVTSDGSEAYVTRDQQAAVSVIDTATNTVSHTIPVVSRGEGVAVAPDGSQVYVVHRNADTVSVIDTATHAVTGTVPVGHNPSGAAVAPDGAHVYVTNLSSGTVSVIETATHAVSTIGVGAHPYGVAVSPDSGHVYVANNAGSISVVDAATNAVSTISVGGAPDHVAITPDGAHAWVTDLAGHSAWVIDTASNTVSATLPLPGSPFDIAITPDGARAYISGFSANGPVTVIDTATHAVTQAASLGGFARGIAIGTITVPTADLEVELTAQASGLLFSAVTYTMTTSNHGPQRLQSATVTLTYPQGLTSPSAPGCTVNPSTRTVTCPISALTPGASATRQITTQAHLLALGSQTATATRTTSAPADPNHTNDTATATCQALTTLLVTC
ncbi:hypothetical protein ACFWIB_40590 [Streptomyces sp. NPDC127051]|uniref:YVTN family beta-propeller repeat protein n=1 Tax=Streptomyces sp. NPDC127051 TaxID=3347119 RepID=UPI00366333DA